MLQHMISLKCFDKFGNQTHSYIWEPKDSANGLFSLSHLAKDQAVCFYQMRSRLTMTSSSIG